MRKIHQFSIVEVKYPDFSVMPILTYQKPQGAQSFSLSLSNLLLSFTSQCHDFVM